MLLEKMFLCCGIVIPEIKRGNGTRRIWFEWNWIIRITYMNILVSGNWYSRRRKLFDWLIYNLSGIAVLSSAEPLCGAVAGFTMPQYLIGFHQSINDSSVFFWLDSTDTNDGIFIYKQNFRNKKRKPASWNSGFVMEA